MHGQSGPAVSSNSKPITTTFFLSRWKRLLQRENVKKGGGFALEIEELTRDLHSADCRYESRKTMTEYEKKFSGNGKNINYVKVVVRKRRER